MKLKLGIFAILFSTLSLLGLIYMVIHKISVNEQKHVISKNSLSKALMPQKELKNTKIPLKGLKNNHHESGQEQKIIEELTSLSDLELKNEQEQLSIRITEGNLFSALEQNALNNSEKEEAKSIIERFTLLNLEGTRRQYLPHEPELKNALFAHRDSFKDIRALLSRY